MAQRTAESGAILVTGKAEHSQKRTVRIVLSAAIEFVTSPSFYRSVPIDFRHSTPLARIVSRCL
jgi:hypothetical protein